MPWSFITNALKLVPPIVSAVEAVGRLFKSKRPDPSVAEAERHATESGAARNRSGKATERAEHNRPR